MNGLALALLAAASGAGEKPQVAYGHAANAVTRHGCACSGVSSPHGFGASCAPWETPEQAPWCYVDPSCPTPTRGDFGKWDECVGAGVGLSGASDFAQYAQLQPQHLGPAPQHLGHVLHHGMGSPAAGARAALGILENGLEAGGRGESAPLLRILYDALNKQAHLSAARRTVHQLLVTEHEAQQPADALAPAPRLEYAGPGGAPGWWGGGAGVTSLAALGAPPLSAAEVAADARAAAARVSARGQALGQLLERHGSLDRAVHRLNQQLDGPGSLGDDLERAGAEARRLQGVLSAKLARLVALAPHTAPPPRAPACWPGLGPAPAGAESARRARRALREVKAEQEASLDDALARLERAQAMQARVDAALNDGRADDEVDGEAAAGDLGAAIGAARAALGPRVDHVPRPDARDIMLLGGVSNPGHLGPPGAELEQGVPLSDEYNLETQSESAGGAA